MMNNRYKCIPHMLYESMALDSILQNTQFFIFFFSHYLFVCYWVKCLISYIEDCRLPTHTHSHSQAAIINSRSAKMTNAPIQFLATTTTTTTRKVKKKRSPKADRNRDWRRSVPQSTCGSLMSHSHTFFRRRKPLNHVLRYVKGTQKMCMQNAEYTGSLISV